MEDNGESGMEDKDVKEYRLKMVALLEKMDKEKGQTVPSKDVQ